MATGPGDEMAAAAGHDRLRASHADRERVIETLKTAFVQGRLARDEFDLRIGQTFASRTYAELAAVTADLPAKPAAAQPPQSARARGEQPVLRPGPVIMVATALYAGVWPLAFLLPKNSEGDPMGTVYLAFTATLVYLLVLLISVGVMVANRHEKCSSGQPPGRPAVGAGGRPSQSMASADPSGEFPPVDRGHRRTADTARSRPARTPLPGLRSACPGGLRTRGRPGQYALAPASGLARSFP